MEKSLRFLFLPSATGGGHFRASRAVASELANRGAEVAVIDVLQDYAPWPFSGVPGGYSGMLVGGGVVYGRVFRFLDQPALLAVLHRLLWPFLRRAARRLLEENGSDLIVVSHPLPMNAVARAAKAMGGPPVVGFATDLLIGHSLNVSPDVRDYLVASAEVRGQLEERGADAEMHEVGLPVSSAFGEIRKVEPAVLRAELELDPQRPVVLMMAGGEGWGRVEKYVSELAGLDLPLQLVVVAGGNRDLSNRLRRSFSGSGVRVMDFVEDIHRWMRAADVLVTKAGPNSIAEALVLGLPMVLFNAIPVQETANVEWVVSAGAGCWAPKPEECALAVRHLLTNGDAAATMATRAIQLARPDAAGQAADVLWKLALTGSDGERAPLPGGGSVEQAE